MRPRNRRRCYLTLGFLVLSSTVAYTFWPPRPVEINYPIIKYSDFLHKVAKGKVEDVEIWFNKIHAKLTNGKVVATTLNRGLDNPVPELKKNKVGITIKEYTIRSERDLKIGKIFGAIVFFLIIWSPVFS